MGKNSKKIISIFLMLTLVFSIVGCSSINGKSAMGRYEEEIYEAPADIEVQNITLLEDNKIGLVGYSKADWKPVTFISEDGGTTWIENPITLPTEEGKETIPNVIGYLANGKLLISYYTQEPITEEMMEIMTKEDYVYKEPEFKYVLIEKDGSFKNVEIDLSLYNDEEGMGWGYSNFKSNKNGDVFFIAGSQNDKIVQFDGETFEEKNIFEGVEYINDFFLVGDSLLIYDFQSIMEFDTVTGTEKGNLETLQAKTMGEGNNYYPTFLNSGSEEKLYYYTTLGLYEYDMKTEEVKQLVDSAISSFGYANMNVTSFIEKENGDFLATFMDWSNKESTASIINFSYNPDIPTVPEKKLVVYSLLENYQIRQSISNYAKANPDTYVKYEIGLNYGEGKTQSDALKSLNTEIMAGNGPDVIILDGLSADSYIEKGLLEDLSDVINPLVDDGTIFKNIAEAYTSEGKIYQIPTTFKYPVLLGKKEHLDSVSDLNSLVELTKKLSTSKEQRVFDNYYFNPKSLVYSLYYLYGSDWLKEDDTINEDSLNDFFTKVKEMYLALKENEENYNKYMNDKYAELDMPGMVIDEEIIEEEIIDEEIIEEEIVEDPSYEIYEIQYYLNPSVYASSFLFDNRAILGFGGFTGTYDYESVVTLLNSSPEISYKALTRGEEKIFTPSNLIGLNAKGKNKDDAKEVIKTLIIGNENERYSYEGFTVNKKTFENSFVREELNVPGYELEFDEATNHYTQGTMGWGDEFGNVKEIKMLIPNEEDIKKLREEIESLNTGTKLNTVLLTEVAKQFSDYAEDKISLEDAINNIIDNLDLYLSE